VLETKAALSYLQKLHNQFNDWNLAAIAYEVGEDRTQQLIDLTGSRKAWDLARSHYASEDLKQYMPALSTSIIMMHNPALVS
jgi:membrane-bound lytic murein transglycosylase D